MKEKKSAKNAENRKPLLFSEPIRRIIFFSGIVIIVSALALIAYAVIDMSHSKELESINLNEAKQIASATPSLPQGSSSAPETPDPVLTYNEVISPSPSPKATLDIEKKSGGEVIGFIEFSTILDDDKPRQVPIVEGTEDKDLDKGAGHYLNFAYPGETGNCLIYGHRTTVFKNFDKLKNGDSVKVVTPYGSFTYTITDMQITVPMDPLMFKLYSTPTLTLVTCYPFIYTGHAPKRYVVIASLEGTN